MAWRKNVLGSGFLLEPMLCFTFMFQEIKKKKSQVFAENVSTACMLCELRLHSKEHQL